jgi:hypothetical protein
MEFCYKTNISPPVMKELVAEGMEIRWNDFQKKIRRHSIFRKAFHFSIDLSQVLNEKKAIVMESSMEHFEHSKNPFIKTPQIQIFLIGLGYTSTQMQSITVCLFYKRNWEKNHFAKITECNIIMFFECCSVPSFL